MPDEAIHVCYDDWWYDLLPTIIVGLVIYGVGIPVMFFVLLFG